MLLGIITGLLVVIIVVLFIVYRMTAKELQELRQMHQELEHDHRSKNVKHGKSFEHFVPFTHDFEAIAHRENFTFLGMPIDGIAFEEDAIKFIEIKTGTSSLNTKQRRIRDLIHNKKVEWHELHFD